GVGDLVGFVEDVDLETVARGAVAGGLAELADFIDATIGGGVDFDDVDGGAGLDFLATVADAAGFGDGVVGGLAIQGHGEDSRDGGFADAAVPAEDVAVGNALLLDGVLES